MKNQHDYLCCGIRTPPPNHKETSRLQEKSKAETLKQDYFDSMGIEQLELRVAAYIDHAPPDTLCEKCGRRYCDHENKY